MTDDNTRDGYGNRSLASQAADQERVSPALAHSCALGVRGRCLHCIASGVSS